MFSSTPLALYLLALLSGCHGGLVGAQSCQPDQKRNDCGYFGITEDQCHSKGCCWNSDTKNVPWCFSPSSGPPSSDSQCITNAPRFDCGKEGTNQQECEAHGCCWDAKPGNPYYCFFKTPKYVVQQYIENLNGFKMIIKNNASSAAASRPGDPISPLVVELIKETNYRLHIKIYDPNNERWEVPDRLLPIPPIGNVTDAKYDVEFPTVGGEFSFAVLRRYYNMTFFNTSSTGLIFTDQFLKIGTFLSKNYNIYGLGEHKAPLRLDSTRTYTLWNYDVPTPEYFNLYGSHPFYLEVNPDGKSFSHGVFLRNSNGMDIQLEETSLTYKVLGGVLDFYFFLGETPDDVIHQYHEVIGRPAMPPYWALGFHQCRYGFKNLQEVKDVVSNFTANKIPLDTMWTDIDYMDQYKDFTTDPSNFPTNKLKSFISELHSNGQHYVVIIDPAISNSPGYQPYKDGVDENIFIKSSSGDVFIGKVWPGLTAFPDFFNPNTHQYWEKQIAGFIQKVPVDGLWIDMNEPSNFCNGACAGRKSSINATHNATKTARPKVGFDPTNPPYRINNQDNYSPLNSKTLDMDTVHYNGTVEYNVHNLYGFTEAIATNKALQTINKGKRPFILSRSTFAGSGVYTGHWTGDNRASAEDLYYSIPGILNFQMFGVPLVGSDICGFIGTTSEELCARWMALGAFYPFSRNHNTEGAPSQEPYRWKSVAEASRNVLGIRYSLLPYYYTLFFKAHHDPSDYNIFLPSALILKPLFFDFPTDSKCLSIDTQFLVGSALLVSPQLKLGDEGKSLSVYFPSAKWYDWYTYKTVSEKGGETIQLDTPMDQILIHLRGGYIIPMQKPGLTTTESRKNPYSLLVALKTSESSGTAANGDIYLDDGETIDATEYTYVQYFVSGQQLGSGVQGTGYASKYNLPPLMNVTIVGVASKPSVVSLNGKQIDFTFKQDPNLILYVNNLNIPMDTKFTLDWM